MRAFTLMILLLAGSTAYGGSGTSTPQWEKVFRYNSKKPKTLFTRYENMGKKQNLPGVEWDVPVHKNFKGDLFHSPDLKDTICVGWCDGAREDGIGGFRWTLDWK